MILRVSQGTLRESTGKSQRPFFPLSCILYTGTAVALSTASDSSTLSFKPSDPMAPRQELCGSVKVDRAASDIGQERANSREMVEVIPSSTDGQYLF